MAENYSKAYLEKHYMNKATLTKYLAGEAIQNPTEKKLSETGSAFDYVKTAIDKRNQKLYKEQLGDK